MLIERLERVALLGSAWVLYLLIGLSVLSLGIALDRAVFFRTRRSDVDRLSREVVARLRARDLAGAEKLLRTNRSLEAEIVLPALAWLAGGATAFGEAVDAEVARARSQLDRGATLLGTIGNNAPFVGLLGTVLGVIQAFHQLGEGANKAAMGNVMSGIAEALIATGVGLVVALPAVVAYNLLQKAIGDVESNVAMLSKRVAALLDADATLVHDLGPRAHDGVGAPGQPLIHAVDTPAPAGAVAEAS